mgnify:CR=1 FL=1
MEMAMPNYLDWKKLLSAKRLEPEPISTSSLLHEPRSPFERDCSRIIFSDAFHRLGRKTQVHSLSKNDHIHTRLTHSQEVAWFGHSLACCVWDYMSYLTNDGGQQENKNIANFVTDINMETRILIKHDFNTIREGNFSKFEFASIVQAASFAHDIGNPPFGHAGEDAIRDWMKTHEDLVNKVRKKDQRNDIRHFEGNAQGFRLVTSTEGFHDNAGLNLTAATLGAMIKYPRSSTDAIEKENSYKYNYLQSEIETVKKINNLLGLSQLEKIKNARHPLSYLMEAADDICYAIIDIEDAIELKIINIRDIKRVIENIITDIKCKGTERNNLIEKNSGECQLTNKTINVLTDISTLLQSVIDNLDSNNSKCKKEQGLSIRRVIAKYRSPLMNLLTNLVANAFIENYQDIMKGTLKNDLIKNSKWSTAEIIVSKFKDLNFDQVLTDPRINELEVGCNSTIGVLLESFFKAADDICSNNEKDISVRSKKVRNLMSHHTKITNDDNHYTAYLKVLDFISGMTDNYASYLSKQLHGIFSP